MLFEELGVEFDVAGLVDAMDVAEASSYTEVWRDFGEGGPDLINVFGLGVERVVVNILVVDTIFFATSNSDFL